MRITQYQGLPRVIIDPGESYVTDSKEEIISTLLGSCVAACLYDAERGIIGMNHFLLAQQHSAQNNTLLSSESGRYGIHAMELLINQMLKKGAQRSNLKAKAFGGGNVLKLGKETKISRSIGMINCEFIKTFLFTERIPLVASGLGGNIGRNIFFLASDYSVYVKRIEHEEEQTLITEERHFLENDSVTQSHEISKADFW